MMLAGRDFAFVQTLLKDRAGLVLLPEKGYFVVARLEQLVGEFGFPSVERLIAQLRGLPHSELEHRVVEAIVTSETSFFRDGAPFAALGETLLPELLGARAATRRLRLCSAGCASGQEAYSLAMLLQEEFASATTGWDVRIHGFDISRAMVARAASGAYRCVELHRGLSAERRRRFFRPEGGRMVVCDELRRLTEFQCRNVLEGWGGTIFDVVLLRNVLMYFDPDTRIRLLAQIRRVLPADGVLIVGSTETLFECSEFTREIVGGATVYRPRLPAPVGTSFVGARSEVPDPSLTI